MKTIEVKASKAYKVLIGSGLLQGAGAEISNALCSTDKSFNPKERKIAIISDEIVFPFWGEMLVKSLKKQGFSTVICALPPGENSKNITNYGKIIDFLCDNSFNRQDIVLTLGGGVVGDIGGFAAATYQRGIRLVHCPTTLLAAVDSSVGGKTAINLSSGKNQAGCFYQPDLVICDTDCLCTLPQAEFLNGLGEVIKYSAMEKTICGKEACSYEELNTSAKQAAELSTAPLTLIEVLKTYSIGENLEDVIEKCVSIKSTIVSADEYDTGLRAVLNFGHTFGHAIESLSKYKSGHGQAVAAGMAIIAKAAASLGYCSQATSDELTALIEANGLPARTTFSAEEISSYVEADKKNDGTATRLIVPVDQGRCKIVNVKNEDLLTWLKAGGVE